jgi:hypothetical protein
MLRIIVTLVESERFGGTCATSGNTTAPPNTVMKSRRFMTGRYYMHRAPLPLVSIFLHDGFRTYLELP